MRTKKRLLLRAVAASLIVTFVCGELHAAPLAMPSPLSAQQSILRDPSLFQAPLEFARLSEIHAGNQETFIIHIQDAHSNFSGQENLAGALDELMKKYDVRLVLSEGGWGDCSLTPMKNIASTDVWQKVARRFLVTGELQGEEYLNLITDRPMKIVGIEDAPLYDQGLENYRKLSAKREAVLEYLSKTERAVEKVKSKLYPKHVLQYEKIGEAAEFERGFDALWKMAQDHQVDLSEFTAITELASVREKEKRVNYEAANLEQAVLAEEISRRGGKTDLDAYLADAKKMKGQKLAQFTYYRNMMDIGGQKGLDTSKYENLNSYFDVLKDFSALDFDGLLAEFDRAEDKVYASVLTSEDAKMTRSIDRFVRLLRSAHRIQMTSDQFRLFTHNEPDFGTEAMQAFLNRKLAELGYHEDLIPYEGLLAEGREALGAFYDSVKERDFAFVKNVESALKDEKQKVAVLITGGYHTPHLKTLLQEKGWGYAVLTPIVTSETSQTKYEKLLLSEKAAQKKKTKTFSTEMVSKDKSLGALDGDLAKLTKRKSEQMRPKLLALDGARLAAITAEGSRLSVKHIGSPDAVEAVKRPSVLKNPPKKQSDTVVLKKKREEKALAYDRTGKPVGGARLADIAPGRSYESRSGTIRKVVSIDRAIATVNRHDINGSERTENISIAYLEEAIKKGVLEDITDSSEADTQEFTIPFKSETGARLATEKQITKVWLQSRRGLEEFVRSHGWDKNGGMRVPPYVFGPVDGQDVFKWERDSSGTPLQLVVDSSKQLGFSESVVRNELFMKAYERGWFEDDLLRVSNLLEAKDRDPLTLSDEEVLSRIESSEFDFKEISKQVFSSGLTDLKGRSVLDLGAGLGEMSFAVARAGGNATAFESASSKLKERGERYYRTGIEKGEFKGTVRYANGKFSDLASVSDDSYDIAVMKYSLYFSPERLRKLYVKNALSKLKPGGKLIIIEKAHHMAFDWVPIGEVNVANWLVRLLGVDNARMNFTWFDPDDPSIAIIIEKAVPGTMRVDLPFLGKIIRNSELSMVIVDKNGASISIAGTPTGARLAKSTIVGPILESKAYFGPNLSVKFEAFGNSLEITGLGVPTTKRFFEGEVVGLGRGYDNAFRSDEDSVSRRQAEIKYQEGKFLIRDLRSANGSFLKTGEDIVQVGTQFEALFPPSPAKPANSEDLSVEEQNEFDFYRRAGIIWGYAKGFVVDSFWSPLSTSELVIRAEIVFSQKRALDMARDIWKRKLRDFLDIQLGPEAAQTAYQRLETPPADGSLVDLIDEVLGDADGVPVTKKTPSAIMPVVAAPVSESAKRLDAQIPWKELVREASQPEPTPDNEPGMRYWSNNAEARAFLKGMLRDSWLTFSGHAFKDMLSKAHRIAAAGKSGDRPYYALKTGGFEMGGTLRKSGAANNYKDQAQQVAQDAEGAGLNASIVMHLKDPRGVHRVRLSRVPENAWPRNAATVHDYPDASDLDAYFQAMADIFNGLAELNRRSAGPSPQKIELIAEFYQYAVNARPFTHINNSLFMNFVNLLLHEMGLNGIPHGILDHSAMRLQTDKFKTLFVSAVDDANKKNAGARLATVMRDVTVSQADIAALSDRFATLLGNGSDAALEGLEKIQAELLAGLMSPSLAYHIENEQDDNRRIRAQSEKRQTIDIFVLYALERRLGDADWKRINDLFTLYRSIEPEDMRSLAGVVMEPFYSFMRNNDDYLWLSESIAFLPSWLRDEVEKRALFLEGIHLSHWANRDDGEDYAGSFPGVEYVHGRIGALSANQDAMEHKTSLVRFMVEALGFMKDVDMGNESVLQNKATFMEFRSWVFENRAFLTQTLKQVYVQEEGRKKFSPFRFVSNFTDTFLKAFEGYLPVEYSEFILHPEKYPDASSMIIREMSRGLAGLQYRSWDQVQQKFLIALWYLEEMKKDAPNGARLAGSLEVRTHPDESIADALYRQWVVEPSKEILGKKIGGIQIREMRKNKDRINQLQVELQLSDSMDPILLTITESDSEFISGIVISDPMKIRGVGEELIRVLLLWIQSQGYARVRLKLENRGTGIESSARFFEQALGQWSVSGEAFVVDRRNEHVLIDVQNLVLQSKEAPVRIRSAAEGARLAQGRVANVAARTLTQIGLWIPKQHYEKLPHRMRRNIFLGVLGRFRAEPSFKTQKRLYDIFSKDTSFRLFLTPADRQTLSVITESRSQVLMKAIEAQDYFIRREKVSQRIVRRVWHVPGTPMWKIGYFREEPSYRLPFSGQEPIAVATVRFNKEALEPIDASGRLDVIPKIQNIVVEPQYRAMGIYDDVIGAVANHDVQHAWQWVKLEEHTLVQLYRDLPETFEADTITYAIKDPEFQDSFAVMSSKMNTAQSKGISSALTDPEKAALSSQLEEGLRVWASVMEAVGMDESTPAISSEQIGKTLLGRAYAKRGFELRLNPAETPGEIAMIAKRPNAGFAEPDRESSQAVETFERLYPYMRLSAGQKAFIDRFGDKFSVLPPKQLVLDITEALENGWAPWAINRFMYQLATSNNENTDFIAKFAEFKRSYDLILDIQKGVVPEIRFLLIKEKLSGIRAYWANDIVAHHAKGPHAISELEVLDLAKNFGKRRSRIDGALKKLSVRLKTLPPTQNDHGALYRKLILRQKKLREMREDLPIRQLREQSSYRDLKQFIKAHEELVQADPHIILRVLALSLEDTKSPLHRAIHWMLQHKVLSRIDLSTERGRNAYARLLKRRIFRVDRATRRGDSFNLSASERMMLVNLWTVVGSYDFKDADARSAAELVIALFEGPIQSSRQLVQSFVDDPQKPVTDKDLARLEKDTSVLMESFKGLLSEDNTVGGQSLLRTLRYGGGVAAYDLKNKITPIYGYLSMAQEPRDEEDRAALLSSAMDSVDAVETVLSVLRAYAKSNKQTDLVEFDGASFVKLSDFEQGARLAGAMDRQAAFDIVMSDANAWIVYADMLKLGLRNVYYGRKAGDKFLADAEGIARKAFESVGGRFDRKGAKSDEFIGVVPGNVSDDVLQALLSSIQERIEQKNLEGRGSAQFMKPLTQEQRARVEQRVAVKDGFLTLEDLPTATGRETLMLPFVMYEKNIGESDEAALNRLLDEAGLPAGIASVRKTRAPFLPMGAVRQKRPDIAATDPRASIEASLLEGKKIQKIAKMRARSAADLARVESLTSLRQRVDLRGSDMSEEVSAAKARVESMRAKLFQFARSEDYDFDEGNAAFYSYEMPRVIKEAIDDESGEPKIFLVRASSDGFDLVITDGKGDFQIIRNINAYSVVDEGYATEGIASAELKAIWAEQLKKFECALIESRRNARRESASEISSAPNRKEEGGKRLFGFKQINDVLDDDFGDHLIRLINAQFFTAFIGAALSGGILSKDEVFAQLQMMRTRLRSLTKKHNFTVEVSAVVVQRSDFPKDKKPDPSAVLGILEMLSQTRGVVLSEQNADAPDISVRTYAKNKNNWEAIVSKFTDVQWYKRLHAWEETTVVHSRIDRGAIPILQRAGELPVRDPQAGAGARLTDTSIKIQPGDGETIHQALYRQWIQPSSAALKEVVTGVQVAISKDNQLMVYLSIPGYPEEKAYVHILKQGNIISEITLAPGDKQNRPKALTGPVAEDLMRTILRWIRSKGVDEVRIPLLEGYVEESKDFFNKLLLARATSEGAYEFRDLNRQAMLHIDLTKLDLEPRGARLADDSEKRTIVIQNPRGLHTRASAKFIQAFDKNGVRVLVKKVVGESAPYSLNLTSARLADKNIDSVADMDPEDITQIARVAANRRPGTQIFPLMVSNGARLTGFSITPDGRAAVFAMPFQGAVSFSTIDLSEDISRVKNEGIRGARLSSKVVATADPVWTAAIEHDASLARFGFNQVLGTTGSGNVILTKKIDVDAGEYEHVRAVLDSTRRRFGENVFFEFYDRKTGLRIEALSDAAGSFPEDAGRVLIGEPSELAEAVQRGWHFVPIESLNVRDGETEYLPMAAVFLTAVVVGRVKSILNNNVTTQFLRRVTRSRMGEKEYLLFVTPKEGLDDPGFYYEFSVKSAGRFAIDRVLEGARLALEAIGNSA